MCPDQVAALKGELDSYLIAQTHQALEAAKELQEQGLPKESAEVAKADLLTRPPEEDYRPKKWEIEGASEDFIAAARRHLLNRPRRNSRSTKSLAPTT
jgi:hypothetical protein